MSQEQKIGLIVGVVALVLVLAVTKKIMKAVLGIAVIIITCVYMGVISPKEAEDISKQLLSSAQTRLEKVAEASENVKISKNSIKVCINGTWYDVNEIANTIEIKDGVYSIRVNGKKITVSDKQVQKVLSTVKGFVEEQTNINVDGVNKRGK